MDTPDGKVIRIIKVRVTPAPFETEIRVYAEGFSGVMSVEEQLEYAINVAEERFADAVGDREYPNVGATVGQKYVGHPAVEVLEVRDV